MTKFGIFFIVVILMLNLSVWLFFPE